MEVESPSDKNGINETAPVADEQFTKDQFLAAWNQFAEQRKAFHLDYQLLTQPVDLAGHEVRLSLTNPIQETTLNNLRVELTTFLRENLRNTKIQLSYELRVEESSKKVMYTNREKFDYLIEKNPAIRQLKDRLGLDTDF